MGLVAGAAGVELTAGPGVGMMGYGAREGVATGIHDPLAARALFLRAGDGEALLVSADLCLIAPEQADRVRSGIAARTGLRPHSILVSCTHTHSGPDMAARAAGGAEAEHVARVLTAIEDAGVAAAERAEPATLRWARGEAAIGRNRRIADGPLCPDVWALRVDARRGDRTLAVAFHHACHGTVLGHDNLELSADWPGAAAARIAEETGAVALFLLGAHADVDPRTRGLMDAAIPGQSAGLGFEAVRVLGLEVAEAALEALRDAPGPGVEGPIGAAAERVRLPLHLGDRSEADARDALDRRARELAALLGVAELPRLRELDGLARRVSRDLPLREVRRRIAATRLYLRDKTAPFFTGGRRQVEVEVQVLRVGDAALLALPVEPTTRVGLDWRERTRGRAAPAAVCGIANGWLRYLPHPDDYAHPRADEHYEITMSLLAPGSCAALLDTAEKLTHRLW